MGKNRLKILIFIVLLFITSSQVFSSPTTPVSEQTILNNSEFLINNWQNLSFKHQKANNTAWVEYVNAIHDPVGLNWIEGGILGVEVNYMGYLWKCEGTEHDSMCYSGFRKAEYSDIAGWKEEPQVIQED